MPKKTRTTRTRKPSTSSTRGTTSRKTPSAKRGVSSTKPSKTRAPIKTTQESHSGRNQRFKTAGGRNLSRSQLVREIEQGRHPDYHVRVIRGIETPVSNPDGNTSNNLDDD
jgi:hypothetical protein